MSKIWKCGKCGKNYENDPRRNLLISKVILAGHANLLCSSCKMMLQDEVESLAKRYLVGEI